MDEEIEGRHPLIKLVPIPFFFIKKNNKQRVKQKVRIPF
jgi:hypothetical protein